MKRLNFFALMICFLSLSQVIGFFTNNYNLFWLGKASAFSPLPIPFREYHGYYENFTVRETITLVDKNGNSTVLDKKNIHEMTDGPHRRKVLYYSGLGHGPIVGPALYTPIIQYIFCDRHDYRSVHITYQNKKTNKFYEPIDYTCI